MRANKKFVVLLLRGDLWTAEWDVALPGEEDDRRMEQSLRERGFRILKRCDERLVLNVRGLFHQKNYMIRGTAFASDGRRRWTALKSFRSFNLIHFLEASAFASRNFARKFSAPLKFLNISAHFIVHTLMNKGGVFTGTQAAEEQHCGFRTICCKKER